MLQSILLVVLIFVCVALIAVILLQRSEGGALGMGGGPSGFMSTRGVGDLLSRTTGILAGVFFVLCLSLTLIMGRSHKADAVVDRLKIQGLDPAALAAKQAAAQAAAQAPTNTTAPPINPNAPLLLEAPKPQVHTTPSTAPLATPPAHKVVAAPAASAPASAPAANTTAPAKP